jgi:hypothetical protein
MVYLRNRQPMNTTYDRNRGGPYGRIVKAAHTAHPWQIHEIAPDFQLEDVWALLTPGGPDDFHLLISGLLADPPEKDATAFGRLLWAIRWKMGKWFGWDRRENGLNSRVVSLRNRLPPDIPTCADDPDLNRSGFTPLYQLPDEYASEIANSTVHAILHLGWVEQGPGSYRGQLAILVKPNGSSL